MRVCGRESVRDAEGALTLSVLDATGVVVLVTNERERAGIRGWWFITDGLGASEVRFYGGVRWMMRGVREKLFHYLLSNPLLSLEYPLHGGHHPSIDIRDLTGP